MIKDNSMIGHNNMFFSFIRHIIFFQKDFKGILIHFFLKAAPQFAMKLHSKPQQQFGFFFVYVIHIFFL